MYFILRSLLISNLALMFRSMPSDFSKIDFAFNDGKELFHSNAIVSCHHLYYVIFCGMKKNGTQAASVDQSAPNWSDHQHSVLFSPVILNHIWRTSAEIHNIGTVKDALSSLEC